MEINNNENLKQNVIYKIIYNKFNDSCLCIKRIQDIIYEDFDNKIPNEYYKLEELGLIKYENINKSKMLELLNSINTKDLIKIDYESFYESKKFKNHYDIYKFIENQK